MSRVETALEELIAAVIASEEYREYDRQKQIMKEQPELKAQIDRFRQENFELHSVVEAPSTAPAPTAESAPAPVSAPAATDNIKEEVAQPVVPAAKSKDGFFKKMFHS